jgi:hypothetical protein
MAATSIRDVAERAGVSVGTVSNVLNNPARVSPASVERVLAVIEELGYVRNDAARQLRAGRSTTIGLVVLDVRNPFFTDVARGAEDEAARHALSVILGNSDEDTAREAAYLDLFEEQRVHGVLISPYGEIGPTSRAVTWPSRICSKPVVGGSPSSVVRSTSARSPTGSRVLVPPWSRDRMPPSRSSNCRRRPCSRDAAWARPSSPASPRIALTPSSRPTIWWRPVSSKRW